MRDRGNMELYLKVQLQFFADDDAGDKTEEPTQKKLDDARKNGQVAKSRELDNAVGLITLFVILEVFIGYLSNGFQDVFRFVYGRIPDVFLNAGTEGGFTTDTIQGMVIYIMLRILLLVAPFFIAGVLSVLVLNIFEVKLKVTTEPLKPKFSKLNPLKGFKRIFSKDSIFELLKSIVKIVLIFGIAYSVIKDNVGTVFVIYDIELVQAVILVGSVVFDVGIRISVVYAILGIVDFIYQKRKYKKDLMMTKQEIKDEYKNSEGDPQIRGKQRQRMREASQRRMMQDVPKADVVITNPTHLAIALQYDTKIAAAPIVLAKGEDFVAQKIKEVAREHDVEIVENKPLARMLYATVDVGQEIPPELYQAVAEVLAMVYSIKNK